MVRHALAQILDPEEGERLPDTVSDRRLVKPEVGRTERYVLLHGGGEDLVVRVLKDDPHELPDLADVLPRYRFAPDQDLAGRRFEYAVEVLEERALPGPVRPDDGDAGLPPCDEVHAAEGGNIAAVDVGEVPGLDQVHDGAK
ncbi:MAG: hypothetical protein BWX50_01120 [Euryarchaeota archaeon ADurb.Bin009]|nr:MAG: hypothetical protein BWX50_01120 [Euryarchaeota archaeon ADurb.Bin009]